jgi:hypothetical protein
MRRWEALTGLGAVACASVGSIPAMPYRFWFTALAVVLIVVIGASRLQAALQRPEDPSGAFDAGERAKAIRRRRERGR